MSNSQVPSKEKLPDWLRRWYALKGELRFREAADEIERLQTALQSSRDETARACQDYREVLAENTKLKRAAHEPATGPVAPIACIRVGEDDTCEVVHLYAPGLPPGEHDLFPVPLNPNGQLAPSMFAGPLCPHGMPLAENICGPCSEGRPNRSTPPPCAIPGVDQIVTTSLTYAGDSCNVTVHFVGQKDASEFYEWINHAAETAAPTKGEG